MTSRIIPIALICAATIGFTACNGGGGELKHVKGVEYRIIKDAKGKNAAIGDIVEFNLKATVDTTVLNDTWKQGQPGVMRLDSARNGDWQAVLPFLSPGDSAEVIVSCDTILKNIPADQLSRVPGWLKKGNKITISISLVSVKNEEEYNKEMEAKQAEQMKKIEEQKAMQLPLDDKALQEYFAKNNIKAQKTESGLYYTIEKPGSGAVIGKGKTASMMYTGKTLDGTPFDSNIDTAIGHHGNDPLTFQVGQGQMIPGVDEGVALLKKGSKATLYLPSPIAYGPQSPNPKIPANAIMIFEVEIKDVQDMPAPPANK
jgi:FKBP-type peptidyl-prolyl cis-trans isomerase FkpA